jgi:putative membrane protein
MTIAKRLCLAITLTVLALSWLHSLWPREQAMHGALTIAGLGWLLVHDRRWPIRTGHFAAICVFFCLHSVAARYLYSYVPYDEWLRQWFGWSPRQAFGWQRNHADHIIHLAFGLCFAPAISMYAGRRWGAARRSFCP